MIFTSQQMSPRYDRWFMTRLAFLLIATVLVSLPLQGAPEADIAKIQTFVTQRNTEALKSMGTGVMPALIQLYRDSDEAGKANVAAMFSQLGWKSPEAKQVLMGDVRTLIESLRVEVQSALGRVSSDIDVIDTLLDVMRNDASPFFRDRAACALAYDQIHLNEKQKVHLYEGLIDALSDPKPDVRSIAALALVAQTGQTRTIPEWKKWLREIRGQ